MGAGEVRKAPPPPPGFSRVAAPDQTPPPPPGFGVLADDHPEAQPLLGSPTGQLHDGDTFRLSSGQKARLYGADAFELAQTGRSKAGYPVPLGAWAKARAAAFAQPGATVTPTGDVTYGRPVVSLQNNGQDAAGALLHDGLAVTTPRYLRNDPARFVDYTQQERGARLNQRGAFAGTFQTPEDYRHGKPDPWAAPTPGTFGDGNSQAVFWDDPTPFQGLKPEVERGYAAVFQDMSSTPDDLLAYAKANGFTLDPATVRERYAERAKSGGAGGKVEYTAPPRVLTDPKDGTTGAILRGFADPLNVLDEAGAVVDSLLPGGERENVWGSDRRFGDVYANNLEQNRSILDYDNANHWWARFGGQLASGLVLPGASVEGVGLAAGRAALRGGASRYAAEQAARRAFVTRLGAAGAIEGGVAGAGAGEDAQGRLTGAAIGAPLGGALALGAGVLAPRIAQLAGKPFSRLTGRTGDNAAEDFADGAVDTGKALTSNDLNPPVPRAMPTPQELADLVRPASPYREPTPTRSLAELSGDERARLDMEMEKAQEPLIFDDTLDGPNGGNWRNETPDEKATRYADIEARFASSRFDRRAGADAPDDMAMASDIERPSLLGPVADDVPPPPPGFTAQPRSIIEPYTDAERLSAAGRVQPRDVLPLPSNAVDGLDEAARIERGRFDPVRAPNEAKALGPRSIPHARTGNSVSVRGPLDLSSWLRMEGGLRPVSGELEHLGITNAPRKGMEMTGGDRLGPLVAPDGMSYDDAAERAWEAGFFPDHAERPTISEFLDTLDATHSGRSRAFRPDDLHEIEAYYGAQQQRYDVERAQDAGAPLTNDRAEPVGLDDLDRNAPPVAAYEEWGENAPNLAGNIRLDKLNSPQEIKRALLQTERVTGGFDAARRGRITQAETVSLARDLGMTADDLLRRRKGQAFNAEEALAARQILARSSTDLVNMAKRIARTDNAGDELEAAFREAWLRHAAIQEQVAGMTAEAGRLLAQFRQVADSSATDRVLPSLAGIGGNRARIKDVAEKIVELENVGTTPAGINQFALKSLLPKWQDRAVELYINSLLSGPQTHATNILSNTLTALAQIPEHAAAAGIGAVRRVLPGQANSERVLFSEVGSRATGMIAGAKEGMRAAARSFLTDDAADAAKVEQPAAIPGKLGQFIRTPTRLLTAEDELFKGMARRMELHGLALRQADKEGLTGKAARDRAADLVLNPPDDMLMRANDYARYLTFQTPLDPGSIAAGFSKGTQRKPLLKLIVPFVRTPMNLLKFAAERSPAAALMSSWRRDVAAGGARRDLAVARAMVGTGIGAALYEMAADGHITGGGPADPRERALMLANGWQPYSFKVGDRYYSYARLDPFSTTIGTAADLHELSSAFSDEEQAGSFTKLGAAILNNLSAKTWLSGISGLVEAINDPQRNLDSFMSRMAGGIAVPALVAQVARTSDPILREARGPIDRIRSRIPVETEKLFPRRDVFGQPVQTEGGLGPDILSPVWTSTARNDPTLDRLIAAGAPISPPQRTYKAGGKSVKWTPEQYDRLQEVTGQLAKPLLGSLTQGPGWSTMPRDDQQDAVRKVMKDVRKEARGVVLRQRRGLFGAPMAGDVPPPPPGFAAVPPPPPGFTVTP